MQQEVIDLTTTKRKAEASDQQAKRRRTMAKSEMPPLAMLVAAGEASSDPFFPDTKELQEVFVKYKNDCTDALIMEAIALPENQSGIQTRLVILSAIWKRKKKFPDFNTLWLQVYCLLMVQHIPHTTHTPPLYEEKFKKKAFKRLEKISELCNSNPKFRLFTNPKINKENVKELLRKVDGWLHMAYELRLEWYSMKKFKEINDKQRYVTFSEGYKRFERCLMNFSKHLWLHARKFDVRSVEKLEIRIKMLLVVKDVRKLQGYLYAMQIHHARQSGARRQHEILKKFLEDVRKINNALSINGEWQTLKRKFNIELAPIPQTLIYF